MYNKLPLKFIGITDKFGMRVHPISKVSTFHYGLDLGWNKYQGEPVLAVHDAKVVYEGFDSGMGNHIVIKYTEDKKTIIFRYFHLKARALVKKGTKIKQGEIIGYMGDTGYALGVHLHLECWICPNNYIYRANDVSKYAKDPLNYCFLFDDQTVSSSSNAEVTKVIGKGTIRNKNIDQIKVVEKNLRCRSAPSLKGKVLGYINIGYFNILDAKTNDGYTWYKVGENKWIAYIKNMTTKYIATKPIKEPIKEEEQKIEESPTEKESSTGLTSFVSPKDDYYYIYLKKGETIYYPRLNKD